MSDSSLLASGHSSFRNGNYAEAVRAHLSEMMSWPSGEITEGLAALLEDNLSLARDFYARSRRVAQQKGAAPRVAVCGWELAHNAAGRALTLAEAYSSMVSQVEIVGPRLPAFGEAIWSPMQSMHYPVHSFLAADADAFVHQSLKLVMDHPYDVVHLSKPRWTTLVMGLLYELVWGAKIIWDVDDEELGFVHPPEPARFSDIPTHECPLAIERLQGSLPTRLAVGQVARFDAVTVSNPALQERYGGLLLPHVRDERTFAPTPERKRAARKKWGIPEDAKVVLFSGTARRHKGVVETAQALGKLGRDDVWFVVVGDFPYPEVKQALEAIEGLQLRVIPGQPYQELSDVVALGDYTVLLQKEQSLVSKYQLPAKLVDALAMGHVVFAQVTPATRWLADAEATFPITRLTVEETLKMWFDSGEDSERRSRGRRVFLEQLSISSAEPVLRELLEPKTKPLPEWRGKLRPLLHGDVQGLLG